MQKSAGYSTCHIAISGEPDSKSDNPYTLMRIIRSSSNGKSLFVFLLCFFRFKSPILLFYPSILTFPQRYLQQITYWRQEELACRLLTHTTPVSRGYSVSMRHRLMCRSQFSSEAEKFITLTTIYSQESSPRCVEMGGEEPEIWMVYSYSA
jgi:hypothetical protein